MNVLTCLFIINTQIVSIVASLQVAEPWLLVLVY